MSGRQKTRKKRGNSVSPKNVGKKSGQRRKHRRSKRIRLGRTGRRLLLVLLITVGPIGFLWYQTQDRETQESVEIRLLEAMDFLRDWERTPIEVVRVLDYVADWVPVSRGVIVDLEAFDENTEFVFGGMPRSTVDLRVLQNQAYLVGYDESRRNPAWVAYRLYQVSHHNAPERPEGFRPDPRTRRPVRSEDYTSSGFDRGHMAPSFGIGLCHGPEAQVETFLMTNVAPQTPELNRGIWNRLEQRIARRISQRFEEVWIVCGPIYADIESQETLSGGVVVPDAFYKIVVDQTNEGIRALAFIIPQNPDPDKRKHEYLVSIRTIEQKTGLNFFSALPSEAEELLETTVNRRVW